MNRSLTTGRKPSRLTWAPNRPRCATDSATAPRPNARVGHRASMNPVQINATPCAAQATVTQTPLSCSGTAMVRNTKATGSAISAIPGGAPCRLIAAYAIKP